MLKNIKTNSVPMSFTDQLADQVKAIKFNGKESRSSLLVSRLGKADKKVR